MPVKKSRRHRGGYAPRPNADVVLPPIIGEAEGRMDVFGETPNINTMQDVIDIINEFIQAASSYPATDYMREYRDIMLHMLYQTMEEANNAGIDDETADALPMLDQKIQQLQAMYNPAGGRRRRRRRTRKH